MQPLDLASSLVRAGTITQAVAEAARRRAQLYGGGLDTILLESGAVTEAEASQHIAQLTGLPSLPAARLGHPDPKAGSVYDAGDAQRMGAIPLDLAAGIWQVVLRPDADVPSVASWIAAQGLAADLFVVPEARHRALMATVYGWPASARVLSLVGRLDGGTRPGRRPPGAAIPPPIVETGPAPRKAHKPAPEPPTQDAPPRPLAPQSDHIGAYRKQAESDDAATAKAAILALLAGHDTQIVPVLVGRLSDLDADIGAAAHAALIAMTAQDFGQVQHRWLSWWNRNHARPRPDWLFDALDHRRAELRLLAEEELRDLTGFYFGYHFDLARRDRQEAARRWATWWRKSAPPGPRA